MVNHRSPKPELQVRFLPLLPEFHRRDNAPPVLNRRLQFVMANVFSAFAKIPVFFREVKGEMVKVAWPSRQDLISATWIVIIMTTILTAYIGALDFVLSKAVAIILK